MGPKKDKKEEAKKEKIIEDKTFGLKNKNKSKAVQNYIKGVENVVKGKGAKDENAEFQEKALKKKLKEEEAFLNSLTKTVKTIQQMDLDTEEEMKSTLCQYYAQTGFCENGDKCKFSHDLNIEYNVKTYYI